MYYLSLQGFFCNTEKDFDSLCKSLRGFASHNKDMMFEICKDRPPHLQYNFDTVRPTLRKQGLNMLLLLFNLPFYTFLYAGKIQCYMFFNLPFISFFMP